MKRPRVSTAQSFFSWRLGNLWLGALALAGVLVVVFGCIAGGARAHGPFIKRDVVRFARLQGVAVATAKKRLRWQRLAPGLSRKARKQLGRTFGGIWIDQSDGGRIKVGIASRHPTDFARARASATSAGLTGAVDLVRVRYREAELKRVLGWMRRRIANANASAAQPMNFGLRPDMNVVELSSPPASRLTLPQRRFAAKIQKRYGRAVILRSYSGKLSPRACIYPYCSSPLRAGIRVARYLAYNSEGCTGGFIAHGRSPDANLYQLSAGHCYINDRWGTKSTSGYFQDIGPWGTHYVGEKGDAGKYQIANISFWTPRAWVYVPRTSDEYKIFDDADPVAGQWLCTSGAFYGDSSCGYVTQIPHITASGMSLVRASFCGQGGDSGAPVYANGIALGLQQGGYSACDSTFTPIHAAENVLSVDVIHEESPPPPPPPMYQLRDSNSPGPPNYAFNLTSQQSGDRPISGDWNGDGIDTAGFYRPSNGSFYLRNSNSSGPADIVFAYGNNEDLPVAGDWNEDGIDTIGVYRPSNGVFYLKNANIGNPPVDYVFAYGNNEDLPIAGDWNNSGTDTVGLYRPSTGVFYLSNTNAQVPPTYSFAYGNPNNDDLPVAGDWDENGFYSVGVYRKSTGEWFLDNEVPGNQPISYVFSFGTIAHTTPIVGDWNGSGTDTPGAVWK